MARSGAAAVPGIDATMGGMCGRYASTKAPADLAEEFTAVDAVSEQLGEEPGEQHRPDYNVAPTRDVIAVVERHPRDAEGTPDPEHTERSLRLVRWGLVPSWAKDPSGAARMINARTESVADKPAYRRAFAARRCLIPADGWYEWQRQKGRQPYYTHYRDGSSVAFAGLWEYWKPKEGELAAKYPNGLVTATILTTDAVGPLAQIHDRMPLVLPPSTWETWLNPDAGGKDEAVRALLTPPPLELIRRMEIVPVSPKVNSVRNNGPELLEPLDPGEVEEPIQLDLLT